MADQVFKSPFADVEIPTNKSLTDYIFEKAKQWGSKTSLVDGTSGREYTFDALIQTTYLVASNLHARGFAKGDVFAIYLPNVPEYAIIFHAISKLGGIATTVNPLYTAEELAFQLKDANAKYLITISLFHDKVVEALKKENNIKEWFLLDKQTQEGDAKPFAELVQRKEIKLPDVQINPQEDAVVLPYSSGTTGLPKGVVLTHYNVLSNVVQILAVEKEFNESDVFIAFLPFFHIYGQTAVLSLALVAGVKVITMPKFDLPMYLEIVQKYKVTWLHLVPPVALALAKHPIIDKFDLSSVKMVFSGAAPLSAELEGAVRNRLKCKVKQAYGMTEMSPASHYPPLADEVAHGSVGFLLPNCEAKIKDLQTGNPLGTNKEGELCIRGPNVMKGYLNRPDSTSSTIDKDGFLHTGDVAYIDDKGNCFIVDRVKELIKYKGYQVAPAELEALLLTHASIADAAVVPVPDEEAGELPKGYVVLKPGQSLTADEIHAFLEPHIAPHKKLRGGIEFCDAIPKSPSGKILRRILIQKEREKKVQH